MKIQPLGDRVVIEPQKAESGKLKSGLYLPETAGKERPEQGKVIAVGPGKINDEGKLIPMKVKEGEVVLFTKYGPNEIKIDDKEYLIAREEDILAVVGERKKDKESSTHVYRPRSSGAAKYFNPAR